MWQSTKDGGCSLAPSLNHRSSNAKSFEHDPHDRVLIRVVTGMPGETHPQVGTFSLRWPWNDASICMRCADVLSPLRSPRCPFPSLARSLAHFFLPIISLFLCSYPSPSPPLSLFPSLSLAFRWICSSVGWLLLMSAGSLSILSPLVQTTLDPSRSFLCHAFSLYFALSMASSFSSYPTIVIFRPRTGAQRKPSSTAAWERARCDYIPLCVPRVSEIPARASERARPSMVYIAVHSLHDSPSISLLLSYSPPLLGASAFLPRFLITSFIGHPF